MATISSANTPSAIQTAITAATNGDTIDVAPGAVSWASGVTLSSSKGLTFLCSGGRVAVTRGAYSGFLFSWDYNSTQATKLSKFDFIQTTGAKVLQLGFNGSETTFTYPKSIISDCTFSGTTVGTSCIFIDIYFGWPLIHSCTFSGDTASEMIHNYGYFIATTGTSGWTQAVTPGSDQATYVEDCTFTKLDLTSSDYGAAGAIQNYTGSRIVFRHNTLTYLQVDCHGTAGYVGCRWFEFYNNVYTMPSSTHGQFYCMDMRGGSGVIFNETRAGGTNSQQGYCSFREEDSGYPALFQIGRGQNQVLDPVYCWNNDFKTGPVSQTSNVVDGRDFYSNTVKPGYTPLSYPHPLRGSGDTTAPNPNPATIASATALSSTSIQVVATTAVDTQTPPVAYDLSTDNGSSYLGLWQALPTFVVTGLTPNTTYQCRVKSRDAVSPTPNVTTQSAASAVTTAPATASSAANRNERSSRQALVRR